MNDITIKYSMSYTINGRTVTKAAECSSDNLRLMVGSMDDVERAIASVRRSVDPAQAPDPTRSCDGSDHWDKMRDLQDIINKEGGQ